MFKTSEIKAYKNNPRNNDDELEKQMEYLTQDTKTKKFIVKLAFTTEDEANECKDKLMSLGYKNIDIA